MFRSGGIVWGSALSGMNLVTCESPRYNFEPSRRTMIAFDWLQLLPLYHIYHHHLYHPHYLHQYNRHHHYPRAKTDSDLSQHAVFQGKSYCPSVFLFFISRGFEEPFCAKVMLSYLNGISHQFKFDITSSKKQETNNNSFASFY